MWTINKSVIISGILTRSADPVIYDVTGATKFAIRDTKLYVPAVFLSTPNNTKLLQETKSDFKGTIKWNKYQF